MADSDFHLMVTASEPTSVKPLTDGKSGALLATYRGGMRAVLKPVKEAMPSGKRRQRGISVRTQPYREVAFCRLASLIGFKHLVPETVLTQYRGAVASAQLYVPAAHLRDLNPKLKDVHIEGWRHMVVQTALSVPKKFWRQLLALDLIAGARDRHANNVGIQMRMIGGQPAYRLVAWDNAVTFGLTFAKYHNVFHKFMFRKTADFSDIWPSLAKLRKADFDDAFGDLLSPIEIEHAWRRLTFFRDDYSYRLPWKVCSQGTDDPNGFPTYESYFDDDIDEENPVALSA